MILWSNQYDFMRPQTTKYYLYNNRTEYMYFMTIYIDFNTYQIIPKIKWSVVSKRLLVVKPIQNCDKKEITHRTKKRTNKHIIYLFSLDFWIQHRIDEQNFIVTFLYIQFYLQSNRSNFFEQIFQLHEVKNNRFYWKPKVSPTECDKTLTTSLSKIKKKYRKWNKYLAIKQQLQQKLKTEHFIKFDIRQF